MHKHIQVIDETLWPHPVGESCIFPMSEQLILLVRFPFHPNLERKEKFCEIPFEGFLILLRHSPKILYQKGQSPLFYTWEKNACFGRLVKNQNKLINIVFNRRTEIYFPYTDSCSSLNFCIIFSIWPCHLHKMWQNGNILIKASPIKDRVSCWNLRE